MNFFKGILVATWISAALFAVHQWGYSRGMSAVRYEFKGTRAAFITEAE